MSAKLIVFDLDGTLIDSRLDLAGAVNSMRSSMGLEPLSAERVVSFIGNGVASLVRRSIADAEVDFDEALRRMKKYYADHLVECTTLYPGVSAGLRELHNAGNRLAVVSNKSTEPSRGILGKLHVLEYFDEVAGGDGPYPLKPEPDVLLALRGKFNVAPDRCWMVGDHYTDMEAGRRAGFHRVLARYGFGDPKEEPIEYEAADFTEFMNLIRGF